MPQDKIIYCIDASALLQTGERYPANEFPEVWETLARLAAAGEVIAPAQALHELLHRAGPELLAWAEANPALFHDAGAEREALAAEIATRYESVFDTKADPPDSGPFAVALAVTHRSKKGNADIEYTLVADRPLYVRPDIVDVCEDPAYDLDIVAPIRMLRNLGLNVPAPPNSLADLYGLWKGMEITEDDIEASKFKTRWFPV